MIVEWTTVKLLMPEIILVVMATWIYLSSTSALKQNRDAWSFVAAASYLVAGYALMLQNASQGWQVWREFYLRASSYASGPLSLDFLGNLTRWFAVLVGLLFALMNSRVANRRLAAEVHGTLMLMMVGLMLVGSANELVMLFLGLELISIPTYVLLFLGRRDRQTAEATAKYFFLSILSSAVLLYGLSFLYGICGTTYLPQQRSVLSSVAAVQTTPLASIALILIVAGLGFKIAAVPFHFYAADVYQGATNANAGLLAIVPKIAGMVALVRFLPVFLPLTGSFSWQMTIALAILTMTIGNICALWQSNVRRLLAYSSIAHAGYMLIGLAAGLAHAQSNGVGALLLYLIVYVLASLATFAALTYLGSEDHQVSGLDELAGLSRSRPITAGVIAAAMFSLAGIPPLAGFWGKFSLFSSAIATFMATRNSSAAEATWFLILAVVGALNAAVAAAYYLRIVAVMYFGAPRLAIPARGGIGALGTMCTSGLLIFLVGVAPGPIVRFAELADRAAWSWRSDVSTQSADFRLPDRPGSTSQVQ